MKIRTNIIHLAIILAIVIFVVWLLPDKPDGLKLDLGDIPMPIDTTFTEEESGFIDKITEQTEEVKPVLETDIPAEDEEEIPDNFTRIEIKNNIGYLQVRNKMKVYTFKIELPFRGKYKFQMRSDSTANATA